MCIAVPVKVLSISGERALVDYGGLKRDVSIALVKNQVSEGDYVIINAGCAIQRIDAADAQETLALMNELLEQK